MDPLDRANEIAVVLGGGISSHGDADPATIARTQAASVLARQRPLLAFVLTGRQSGLDGVTYAVSEAQWMADRLSGDGIAKERMVLEEESRDTIGNAVLVAGRYLRWLEPRPLWIVTSSYHMARSVLAFAATLGAAVADPYANVAARAGRRVPIGGGGEVHSGDIRILRRDQHWRSRCHRRAAA